MATLEPSRPVLWRPLPGESVSNFSYAVTKEELPQEKEIERPIRKITFSCQIKNSPIKLPAWKDFAARRT